MNIEEAIQIVEKFNAENRFRDMGKLNTALNILIKEAKKNTCVLVNGEIKSPSFTKEQLNLMNFGIALYKSFNELYNNSDDGDDDI